MNLRKITTALACLFVVIMFTSCPTGVNPNPTVSVTGVSLDRASVSLSVGDTAQLSATVSPVDATDESVTWSSSAEAIATVSADGLVTAHAVGSATITVTTTDGAKTAMCAVTVEAPVTPSTDAYLSSLTVSVGGTARDLSPLFVKTTTTYSTTVSTDTTEVSIAAVASNAGASITGTGSLTLGVAGTTTATELVVTALDGTTKKTYTIAVKRAVAGASSDASLSALSVSLLGVSKTLDPSTFVSTTYSYTVVGGFPNSTSFAAVKATATDSGATISGVGDRTLIVGANALNVVVTAADGVATKTYTLNVERLNPESDRLSALSANGIAIAFSPDTRSYSLNAENSLSATTISGTPEYSGSTVTISTDGVSFSPFSGSASLSLLEGLNTVTIRVKKQYTGTTADYTLAITRATVEASSDATLSALSVLTLNGAAVALSPAFDSNTLSYTATVRSPASSITVAAAKNDASAAEPVISGNSALSYGSNTVSVSVTAADGITKKTYTIIVTRWNPPTITITSPVNGASIPAGTISVTGTYSDPNGEISDIYVGSYTSSCVATFSGGMFSASLDASAFTNGTKQLLVQCFDSESCYLVIETLDMTITGGATSYTVSFNLVLPDGATSTSGYLNIGLDRSMIMYDIDLSSVVFPLSINLSVPNGTHSLEALVCNGPLANATKYLLSGQIDEVIVNGADINAGSMNLLKL